MTLPEPTREELLAEVEWLRQRVYTLTIKRDEGIYRHYIDRHGQHYILPTGEQTGTNVDHLCPICISNGWWRLAQQEQTQ